MIKKASRRQQILEALAHMLEASPGERITTARLAKEVGVSEAALYRHFPSKSKMFEGLIEFIEERQMSVKFNGEESRLHTLIGGGPQGCWTGRAGVLPNGQQRLH